MKSDNISVGIDIGSTKVCVVAAERHEDGINILGTGITQSEGIRKGVVINVDAVTASIRKAVREAENSAGIIIKSSVIGISGVHVNGMESCGVTSIRGKSIAQADRERAMESARTLYIPLDREMLHMIPAEFIINGQKEINYSSNTSGAKLESRLHIITADSAAVQNHKKCFEQAGIEVSGVVFKPLASARSALSSDDIEKGTVFADIGGGTTDIVFFKGGFLRHSAVLPVGGLHITNDLAVGLNISVDEAEKIKKHAYAGFTEAPDKKEEIKITRGDGCRISISGKLLAQIINPRCEEIIEMIAQELSGAADFGCSDCRVVLAGGSSLLHGFSSVAEKILGIPVRTGHTENIRGLKISLRNPAYAAAIGLALYKHDAADSSACSEINAGVITKIKGSFKGLSGYKDFQNFINKRKKGVSHV